MISDDESPFIIFGAPDIHSEEIDEVVATLKATLGHGNVRVRDSRGKGRALRA